MVEKRQIRKMSNWGGCIVEVNEMSRPVSSLAVKSHSFDKTLFYFPFWFSCLREDSLWDFVINSFMWSKSWTRAGKTHMADYQPLNQGHTDAWYVDCGNISRTNILITFDVAKNQIFCKISSALFILMITLKICSDILHCQILSRNRFTSF